MFKLGTLGFRARIALPFIITAAALVFIGLFSINAVRNLVLDVDEVAENYLPAVSEILNGDRDLYQALVAQVNYVEAVEYQQESASELNDFNENAQQAKDRFKQAASRLAGTGVEKYVKGFDQAFEQWINSAQKVMQMASSGRVEAAQKLHKSETLLLFSSLRSLYDKISEHADKQANLQATEASAEAYSSAITILVITLLTLALSAVLFFIFLKLIVQSIKQIRDQLDNIAQGEGDLRQRIPVTNDDDIGKLSNSFNAVLGNLQQMIGAVQNLTISLKDEAARLAQAAKNNEGGVTQQVDAISMVATAINEMHSAIEEVAGNASQASVLTQSAEENGNRGAEIIHSSTVQVRRLSQQIETAVTAIRKLAEDSENITTVLDVIRGVAEQTNLLALNAAIEAARAGEHGRGFAVVADEVRTLASRTQESTENIQTMIANLQSGVAEVVEVMEKGSKEVVATEKLSADTETELQAILHSISQIADMNVSVASATEEQTQVVDEINRSITEINDLAAEGAARSDEIGKISGALAEYAQELQQQTGRFKV
ncbi:MAG TPA: methyl-accepting chemotaxis protein [Marinospirillum sp.]|uniref:methyl-accepting chemotaxis protein n=1 Tax=Marinospirillum sp. TaxID=2183934 RepID=UPI002B48C7FE|nr:methyl-accepting chemotaxis protein [Marinospirillum sp.]HKM16319.1 methyl-accepting chemotaxis protein [Marinospirillum sp.]